MTDIAVSGALGRMGRSVIAAIAADPRAHLRQAFERSGREELGQTVRSLTGAETGDVVLNDRLADRGFDVLIDFSIVAATMENLRFCRTYDRPMVIGTTGFSASQREQIAAAAQTIPVVFAPNMSVGVNVVLRLLEQAGALLKEKGYDVEILEAHHRHKTDAPSGTALKMGEIVAEAMNIGEDEAIFCRHGQTGPRAENAIAYQVIRAGDIIGDHTVMFARDGDRIEIAHKSSSRMSYAQGALDAARWVVDQPAALYGMKDVLGL